MSVHAALRDLLGGSRPVFLDSVPWPGGLRVLSLAPHPDDFDAVAVTMRRFQSFGADIHVVVATSGWSGVDTGYGGAGDPVAKGALREVEQSNSCRVFGLQPGRLKFLRLREGDDGEAVDDGVNLALLREAVLLARPDIVCMPHGNDTNKCHVLMVRMFRATAPALKDGVVALYNGDPKTVGMTNDAYTRFGDEEAEWKRSLLRCHGSQQSRNMRVRGYGFDERIIRNCRESAASAGLDAPCAERFEIEFLR